ncbi:uncharacterized protein TNIN_479541 [Trichonephila inaurata madagascariensis]|uniref:Uncharacterized protein n=1 Tax=Trichonephila inaurata madagascariensis TaxID=2747483 RepID=A0A8X6YBL1_9ARAC|nr:uncharacterized protein TNIN_479541 [Trichonephila inaurata madagascariensis]
MCTSVFSAYAFSLDFVKTWKTPPSHDWYQQNGPGAALELKGDRKIQTTITRLISGHTRGLTFVQGQKTFPVCLKCDVHQASSEPLLRKTRASEKPYLGESNDGV